MSLGAGSVSLRRIHVLEKPANMSVEWIAEKLMANAINPITLDDTREESSGWCHPFTGDADIPNIFDLVFEDTFIFGMRTDSKKIPGTLFRLQMKAALDSLVRKGNANNDDKKAKKISKTARDATRDRIKTELLKHTLPTIRLVEIAWHLQANEIWISSTSVKALDTFEKLFRETFDMSYVHLNPGTMSVEFSRLSTDNDYSLDALFDLIPSDMLQHHAVETQMLEKTSENNQYF